MERKRNAGAAIPDCIRAARRPYETLLRSAEAGQGTHNRASLSEMAGTSPAMTTDNN
jgi:hypothetical protein